MNRRRLSQKVEVSEGLRGWLIRNVVEVEYLFINRSKVWVLMIPRLSLV